MKHFVLVSILGIALGCGMFACSDDECPTCPSGSGQTGVMTGAVMVRNDTLRFFGFVTGIQGGKADVDSVIVDGGLAEIAFVYEGISGVMAEYEGTTTLESGDTVQVNIYTPSGMSTCRVPVLDTDNDRPLIQSHDTIFPYDTVPVGSDVEIIWQKVDNAEWYLVFVEYRYDSVGTDMRQFSESYATDTSHSIAGTILNDDGRLDIQVLAMTGAMLNGSTGSISGGPIRGTINGATHKSFDINIGTGETALYQPPDETPLTEREILELLY